MRKSRIIIASQVHRENPVVSLVFDKDEILISKAKSLESIAWNVKTHGRVSLIKDATWSQSRRFWYIPKSNFYLSKIYDKLSSVAYLYYSALQGNKPAEPKEIKNQKVASKPQVSIPQAYTNLLGQKRYAENTKAIYLSHFADFIRYFKERNLDEVSKKEINAIILGLIREKNISNSQQNQQINAIKFYYEKVLGLQKEYYDLEWPRKEMKLPDVLSKEEVRQILGTIQNIKRKAIISTIYSGGLRRGELINLKEKQAYHYI